MEDPSGKLRLYKCKGMASLFAPRMQALMAAGPKSYGHMSNSDSCNCGPLGIKTTPVKRRKLLTKKSEELVMHSVSEMVWLCNPVATQGSADTHHFNQQSHFFAVVILTEGKSTKGQSKNRWARSIPFELDGDLFAVDLEEGYRPVGPRNSSWDRQRKTGAGNGDLEDEEFSGMEVTARPTTSNNLTPPASLKVTYRCVCVCVCV